MILMCRKYKKNNKGVTLIEVVIALAILAVIFSLLGPFFVTGIDFFRQSNSRVIDQSNLRKVMTSISREMRDAQTVTINSSTEVDIDGTTYFFRDSDNTIVISPAEGDDVVIAEFVSEFDVSRSDDLITIKTKATNSSSVIVTNVYLRSRPVPTETGGVE